MAENGVKQKTTALTISQQPDGDGMTDLCKDLDDLSPTSKKKVQLLLTSLSRGQAILDVDASGRQVIEYTQAKKVWWDGSNANVINVPKTDGEVQEKVDACLELVDYLKKNRPPGGVVLDKTKISVTAGKQYREGSEFIKTKSILGRGNSAGDIVVVKDAKTASQHAHKTMMISVFRKEEIRCWVDMNDTGYVPYLYLFKVEGNKISIHMEILKDAITLRSIIDDHMSKFYQSEESLALVKPFSLFVLDGVLEAVSCMHQKGWAHRDLHGSSFHNKGPLNANEHSASFVRVRGIFSMVPWADRRLYAGNVMVQKSPEGSLDVKIIDFGLANPIEGADGLDFRGFRADISEVLRLFSGLYSSLEFDNVWDIQHNWKERINETVLNAVDKKELLCLMDAAMKIVLPADVEEYRNLVKEKLHQAVGDRNEDALLREAAAILFPKELKSHPPEPPKNVLHTFQCDGLDEADVMDVADAVTTGYHDNEKQDNDDIAEHKMDVDEFINSIRLSLSITPHS